MLVQTLPTPIAAPNVANAAPDVTTSVSLLWAHKFSLTSRHEPEPYVRSTATIVDHDATEETPTATRAPGDEMRMIMTQMMNINI